MGISERHFFTLTLGERIKFLREACELTQNDIARLLCVSRSTYTYYENGKTEPRIASIVILARFYKLSLDVMLCDLPEVETKRNE